jgi:hemoglobin/transferrin/lactoferrin receptor protein
LGLHVTSIHPHSRLDSRFALREISLLAAMACSAGFAAHAQPAAPASVQVAVLKDVVVSGSRTEQSVEDIPQTIDVINAADIEQGQIRDIRDVAKNIPNVSVRRAPARFGLAQGDTGREGNAGFNIRGLEGNRVLMMVDGIRIPRSYAFTPNSFGRDSVSIDLIKRIEIVKGPASALYGSDGIAGLVNFITNEPDDYLKDGKSLGGRASIGYSGDNSETAVSGTIAGRANEALAWQLSVATSSGKELKNKGETGGTGLNRTEPNPQTDKANSLLAKVVLNPTSSQKHAITFEHVDKKSEYNLLTARSATVLDSYSTGRMDRDRLTWDAKYKVNTALTDNIQTVLSYQDAKSNDYTYERRTALPQERVRDTTYSERTLQASIQADKTIRMSGNSAQKITYGLDYISADIENLQTGLVPPAGETFPLKRFPDTKESATALYVQDEFIVGDWSVTPGVRADSFKIDAAQAGFPVPAVSLSGSAVSPKVGVIYRASPRWTVFGNYASGFRAPNAGQVNGFFQNLAGGYRTVPNPNLKPEKSRNVEFGVRGRLDQLSFDTAVFYGRFKDLIQDGATVSGTFGNPANPAVIQSINIDNATISGFEIKGAMNWGKVGNGQLSTPFAYGYTRGTVKNTGKPLDTIDPAKLVVGVKYETASWDVRLDASHHSAKKFSDISAQTIAAAPPAVPVAFPQFAVPSATTLDLTGQWRISKTLRVNAGIINLTDKKYWNWSDVRGVAANSSFRDAYSQPGRYFNVSLVADF